MYDQGQPFKVLFPKLYDICNKKYYSECCGKKWGGT
jgi:hypothetical protein